MRLKIATVVSVLIFCLIWGGGNCFAEKHKSEQPTAAADVDFGPYMSSLQRKIKSNWSPPKEDSSKKVVVTFKVYADGKVTDIKVTSNSGSPAADTAALKAVEASSPLEPLPKGSPSDVDIQFTFERNVFYGKVGGRGIGNSTSWHFLMQQGYTAAVAQRFEAAQDYFREAASLAEKETPPSVNLSISLQEEAMMALQRRYSEEALTLLNRSLDVLEHSVGMTHKEVANTYERMAFVYERSSWQQAEDYYKRCIAVREKINGPKSVEVANGKAMLGHLYNTIGRFKEAQDLLQGSLAPIEKSPKLQVDLKYVLKELVITLRSTNQMELADKYQAQIAAIKKSESKQSTSNTVREQ